MSITVKDLKKSFNNKVILNNVNLTFRDNDISCIIGPSGCGKTTLLNIILGLEEADSGYIEGIDGKGISVVFQEDRLCEGFSAVANIKLVCDNSISHTMILNSLKEVGLHESDNKIVSQLSGGMRRRVAIVRAILTKADIIVMDEPFKGLDEETKLKVVDYVKRNTKGKIVIITTHNNKEIDMLKATLVTM